MASNKDLNRLVTTSVGSADENNETSWRGA